MDKVEPVGMLRQWTPSFFRNRLFVWFKSRLAIVQINRKEW